MKREFCPYYHDFEDLFKVDEPLYLVNIAFKAKKKDKEEIIEYEKRVFHNSPETFSTEVYKMTYEEYINKLLEAENKKFGNLECAYVPTISTMYRIAPKSELEEAIKELERKMCIPKDKPSDCKVVYTEVKDSLTQARKDLFSKCGLTLNGYDGFPRNECMEIVDRFVDMAKKQHHVSEVYLTGSLARGAASTRDIDVVMVTDSCPAGKCEIFHRTGTSEFQKEEHVFNRGRTILAVDLFCFGKKDFKKLQKGNYRIDKDKKLLFRR